MLCEKFYQEHQADTKTETRKNAHEYVVIIDEKRQNRKASNKDIYSDTHVTNKQKNNEKRK